MMFQNKYARDYIMSDMDNESVEKFVQETNPYHALNLMRIYFNTYNIERGLSSVLADEHLREDVHLEPTISEALWFSGIKRTELSPLVERFLAFRNDDPALARKLVKQIKEKTEVMNANS